MTPEISRWSMAIADMLRFPFRMDTFCFRRTGGNNEIVFSETKAPKSQRTQEHAEFMSTIEVWNIVNKAFVYFSPLEIFWSIREKD